MKHHIALYIASLLVLGANSLRCYKCTDGKYTINGQDVAIPGEVKCDESSKYACEVNMTTCNSLTLSYEVTALGTTGKATATVKGCGIAMTDDMSLLCDKTEEGLKEAMKNKSVTVDNFKCHATQCQGRDYCNAARLRGVSGGVMVLLCTLLGLLS